MPKKVVKEAEPAQEEVIPIVLIAVLISFLVATSDIRKHEGSANSTDIAGFQRSRYTS